MPASMPASAMASATVLLPQPRAARQGIPTTLATNRKPDVMIRSSSDYQNRQGAKVAKRRKIKILGVLGGLAVRFLLVAEVLIGVLGPPAAPLLVPTLVPPLSTGYFTSSMQHPLSFLRWPTRPREASRRARGRRGPGCWARESRWGCRRRRSARAPDPRDAGTPTLVEGEKRALEAGHHDRLDVAEREAHLRV